MKKDFYFALALSIFFLLLAGLRLGPVLAGWRKITFYLIHPTAGSFLAAYDHASLLKGAWHDLFKAREKIYERLAELPRGTIKERLISGRRYYYLQRREGKKVLHTYIGREIPRDLKKQMKERQALQSELTKIQGALLTFLSVRIKDVMK